MTLYIVIETQGRDLFWLVLQLTGRVERCCITTAASATSSDFDFDLR